MAWLFLLVALPDLLDSEGVAQAPAPQGPAGPGMPAPGFPHAPLPGWPLPQPQPPAPAPAPPPAPAPAPQQTFPAAQAQQPFGPNAIVQGEDLVVIEKNGVVFMPYVDSIVLVGTDVDAWPAKLTSLPPDVQQIIAQAQLALVNGELPCRVIGGCEPQAMMNTLYKWAGIPTLTRAQFVAFHLWFTVMAVKTGGQNTKQVPVTDLEKSWSAACLAVAEGTLLSPQSPAFA